MTQILPETNESARSYLVRLSSENDYIEIKQLFSHYQDEKMINISSSENSIIECVCKLVDADPVSFWPMSDEQLSYLINRKPVACPMCMREQNYLVRDWQLMPITHCIKHQTKLFDKCSCGEKFDWDSTLTEYGCSKCLSSWDEIASHCQIEAAPEHVLHFNSLSFEERALFLEDLAESIYRVMRPYDSMHNKVKQLPTIVDDWFDATSRGYALLTDINAVNTWCKSLANIRAYYQVLGEGAIYYPVFNLQNKLNEKWLIKGVKPSLASFSPIEKRLGESSSTPCRIRNEAAKKECNVGLANEQLRNHVDQLGFAEMFKCSVELTRNIFKLACFNNITTIRSGRNSIIDIRIFMDYVKSCDTEDSENTLYLSELGDLKANYLLSDEELALEIIAAKLPLYIDKVQSSFVRSIKVNERVIINFLETEYLNKPDIKFTRTKTAKIIGISRTLVSQLGKAAILIEHDPYLNNKRYTGKSIANFLTNYECIERWGAIHHVDIYTITLALIKNGLNPIFESSIYKKTPKLVSTLNQLYRPNYSKRKQIPLPL